MAENEQIEQKDVYTKEHVEKILKEKKNYSEANETLKTELKAMSEKIKELSENELKVKEDYKTLAENKAREALDYKTKLETLESNLINGTKRDALKAELAKLGADQKAINEVSLLAKIDSLKYDQDHKVVLGVEEEAKRLKEIIPSAFVKVAPKADHSAGGDFKQISVEDFKNMSAADRAKVNVADLFAARGIQMRK